MVNDANIYEEARKLYEEGRAFMDEGKIESAVESFQKSIMLSPHFKTLELLGECLFSLGRLTEAIVPLAAATGLNKGVRSTSLLAQVFLDLGDAAKSFQTAQEALMRDPNNKRARQIIESLPNQL